MEPIRVLIADDHMFFRDGLRVLLEATPDTVLVGEATTGDEAVALTATVEPDVILMDLKMPGVHGIDATRQITAAFPHVGVLVVTMYEDDESVFAAIRAGARGYLLKGADREDMLLAIRAVARGEAIFGPAIARRLTQYFATVQRRRTDVSAGAFPELTERERQLLHLLASGQTNAEFADALFLSSKTVRNYVSNIFAKLQVTDLAQAIILAREAGLGVVRDGEDTSGTGARSPAG
jgi:DNA-binding NarL/FixJ family response regulator